MKRSISLVLSIAMGSLAMPRNVAADDALDDAHTPMSASLVDAGKTFIHVEGTWVRTYNLYSDPEAGDVWGDGYLKDLDSVDETGAVGRWLSYTHENGEFVFLGSDDGIPFRASFGPEDVAWTWSANEGWSADIAHPNSGPQESIWLVVAVVVAATVILSGDSGCSCGHNGGTPNHPGTNHPGE